MSFLSFSVIYKHGTISEAPRPVNDLGLLAAAYFDKKAMRSKAFEGTESTIAQTGCDCKFKIEAQKRFDLFSLWSACGRRFKPTASRVVVDSLRQRAQIAPQQRRAGAFEDGRKFVLDLIA